MHQDKWASSASPCSHNSLWDLALRTWLGVWTWNVSDAETIALKHGPGTVAHGIHWSRYKQRKPDCNGKWKSCTCNSIEMLANMV